MCLFQTHTLDVGIGAGQDIAGALQALMAFMTALNNADADGRIVADHAAGSLKFVLLNAATHFSKVHTRCRAARLSSGCVSTLHSYLKTAQDECMSVSVHVALPAWWQAVCAVWAAHLCTP
jgi:hypothetical protein